MSSGQDYFRTEAQWNSVVEKKQNEEDGSRITLTYEELLKEITAKDNKEEFISLMNSRYNTKKPQIICPPTVLFYVFTSGALECATVLFEGKTPLKVDVNLHASIRDNLTNYTPLHCAASSGNSMVVDFLLCHGASTNIRCISDDQQLNNQLALNAVLSSLSEEPNFPGWTPQKSIFHVILTLCLPRMRTLLETGSLLAESTEEVEEEILYYIIEGKVVELAALLLVSREKVKSQSVFRSLHDIGPDGSMNLRKFLTNEITLLRHVQFKSMHRNTSLKLATKCLEQLPVRFSMLQLVEVYEKIGDKIIAYLEQKPLNTPPQQVAQEMLWMLHDAGFSLKSEDYNMSQRFYFEDRKSCIEEIARESKRTNAPEEDVGRLRNQAIELEEEISLKVLMSNPSKYLYGCRNPAVQSICRSLAPMAIHDHIYDVDRLQPLTLALTQLCNHQYLKCWTTDKSIFKLIYVLCLPKLKRLLEQVRSLACESKDIEVLSCLCLKEGKLIDLAVLLMVAHEKLLVMTPHSEGTFYSEGSMGIHQCLLSEIRSVLVEETRLRITWHSNDFLQTCKNRRAVLSSAQLLLKVFERAGHAIKQYLQSHLYLVYGISNGQVAEDLAYLLKEMGFVLGHEDTDLSDMKCFLPKLELEPESIEKLRKLSERFPPGNIEIPPASQPHRFSSLKKKLVGTPGEHPKRSTLFGSAARSFHTSCSSDSFCLENLKPVATQIANKSIKPWNVKFSFGKQWPIFAVAMARPRRIKRL